MDAETLKLLKLFSQIYEHFPQRKLSILTYLVQCPGRRQVLGAVEGQPGG